MFKLEVNTVSSPEPMKTIEINNAVAIHCQQEFISENENKEERNKLFVWRIINCKYKGTWSNAVPEHAILCP